MDAQAIVLILGGVGGLIGATFAGLSIYKKAGPPPSAILSAFRLLWYWLDFTSVNEQMITKMREDGTISAAIPDHIKVPVLRVVNPQALKTRRASRAREDEEVAEEALDDE